MFALILGNILASGVDIRETINFVMYVFKFLPILFPLSLIISVNDV